MRPPPTKADTFRAARAVFWTLLHLVDGGRGGYQAGRYSPSIRPIVITDSIEISTLRQGVSTDRIHGAALPACSPVYRSVYIFGIRSELALSGGGLPRIDRMRGVARISAGRLIADFGQLRAEIRSFPHFLTDREVATFGPGYYQFRLFGEALPDVSDLFARMGGAATPMAG